MNDPKTSPGRVIGIARQSVSRDDSQSPEQQADRMREGCDRDGLELLRIAVERDVSGGTPLARRHGLREAVEAIERREADILMVAYFDRLVRSLKVQAEVVERVEAVGGRVLALDVGHVTNGSAGSWLSSTMLGAVSEYHRRTTAERVRAAQAALVAEGGVPFPGRFPGYERDEAHHLHVLRDEAKIVRAGFELRAGTDGEEPAPISAVHEFWQANGVAITYWGAQRYLSNRIVLGEVNFGDLRNPSAHTAIVEPDLFRRVEAARVPRGRYGKSERLLARLGVLLCDTCGSRMTANTGHASTRPFYVCKRNACARRVTISARVAEEEVWSRACVKLAGAEGRASAAAHARAAAVEAARLERAYENLVDLLTGREDVGTARAKLDEAEEEAGRARARADELQSAVGAFAIDHTDPRLTLDERRKLIRAVVVAVRVQAGGRGAERLRFEFVGE